MAVRDLIRDDSVSLFTWEGLEGATTDTGAPLELKNKAGAIASVQFKGTFGGTIVLEGSNDGVTYFTLNDTQGTAISKTAAGMSEFSTAARYIRPRAAAGIGDVDVLVYFGG